MALQKSIVQNFFLRGRGARDRRGLPYYTYEKLISAHKARYKDCNRCVTVRLKTFFMIHLELEQLRHPMVPF